MPLLEVEDRTNFLASVSRSAVNETGPNNLITCIIEFDIIRDLTHGTETEEGTYITAFQYLQKRDGNINTFTIDALKDAFGWDGVDVDFLNNLDDMEAEITVDAEEYDGKIRSKVQFINRPGGNRRAVEPADESTMKNIKNTIGAKLRAYSGGTPKPKPGKADKAAPEKKAPAKKAPAKGASAKKKLTIDAVWEALESTLDECTQEDKEQKFFHVVEACAGEKDAEDCTQEEYQAMLEMITELGGDEPPF